MHPESTTHRNILVVGITGGIGCGKSTVSDFVRTSYEVLDSDLIARELIDTREEIQRAIRDGFGTGVFDVNGRLDRAGLAAIVFSNPTALEKLNSMVHPHVMLELDQRVDALAREGKDVVFIESALIFEAAIDDFFDYIIAVVASDQTVIGRLTSTGRMNEDEARARISHQLPVEDKAGRADFTLRNDGTREELRSAVNLILSLIPSLCKMPVQ